MLRIWITITSLLVLFSSCFRHEEKRTYLGGKIRNPKSSHIYLYHNFLPFDKDTIPLDNNSKFGTYLNLDTPATFLFSQAHEVSDLYIRPGDSMLLIANMADFDRTINFSGGEIAAFNNLLKNLGRIAIEQFQYIEPLLGKYSAEKILNFNKPYRQRKKDLVEEFKRTHPDWKWTEKERQLVDYNMYMPDFYLYEKFNYLNRGRDTIRYEIPFAFSWDEKHPMSFFLGLWTKQYIINHVADADINDFSAIKQYLNRIDSLIGDTVLADFAKYRLILAKLEHSYPYLNPISVDSLNGYLDSAFSHPQYARHMRRYMQLFLNDIEGHKALNLLLVNAKNCDTVRLYDLIHRSNSPYVVLVPLSNFWEDCARRYKQIESLRPRFKGKFSFYYLYKRLPSPLKKSQSIFKPDYFYWIYPTSEYMQTYSSYTFKNNIFFILDSTGLIRKIYTPADCRSEIPRILDSIWEIDQQKLMEK